MICHVPMDSLFIRSVMYSTHEVNKETAVKIIQQKILRSCSDIESYIFSKSENFILNHPFYAYAYQPELREKQ